MGGKWIRHSLVLHKCNLESGIEFSQKASIEKGIISWPYGAQYCLHCGDKLPRYVDDKSKEQHESSTRNFFRDE